MKKYVLLLFVFLISIQTSAQYKPWTSAKQPLKEIKALKKQIKKPKFRKVDYLITDFGAVGDGKTKNTEAFKKRLKNVMQKAEEELLFQTEFS
ncbi:hypothetical protein [Chryseobacterium indoltheticum]|uniref:hypothetical protein n=1 Tax=Chryseobacterium indoltheticum TaxID=254 RepID=UPI003F491087